MINSKYRTRENESYFNYQNENYLENQLIEKKLKDQQKFVKRKFLLQIFLNIIILLAYVFACVYYHWYQLGYQSNKDQTFWLNFIYLYIEQDGGDKVILFSEPSYHKQMESYCKAIVEFDQELIQKFNNFAYNTYIDNNQNLNNMINYLNQNFESIDSQYLILQSQLNNVNYNQCMSSLKTVQNLGILCSVLVFTGFICDIVHCIITYRVYKEKTKELTKRKRQLTLSIFVAGIICFTFPIIAYFIVAVFWKSLQFKMKNFGFCYLICTICIFIQICCLCYFQYLKKRLKYKEQVHELFQEVYQTLDSEDNRSSF